MKQLIAALLLICPSAFAQDARQIADFNSGRYEHATLTVNAEPTADLLAFKARAVLASGICSDIDPSLAQIEQAETYARQALQIEPTHVEAQLQLAIALSLKARSLSNREAMRAGYGEEAKDLALHALEQDPANAYANGFMAVWNIEVVRRGGAIGSRLMGASVTQARRYYQAATADRPDDASIHWQYARALAALNPRKYAKEISAALIAAESVPAETHVERVMQTRALKLQQLIQSASHKDVEDWAGRML